MGIVYKAEDIKFKRTVALKFLSPELTRDPEAKARFIREDQAGSTPGHPGICDIQGRLISTLVDENMVPGNYTVNFNAATRAAGIYFYRIKMGTFTATGKMILSR